MHMNDIRNLSLNFVHSGYLFDVLLPRELRVDQKIKSLILYYPEGYNVSLGSAQCFRDAFYT